jgi:hypothetical protein
MMRTGRDGYDCARALRDKDGQRGGARGQIQKSSAGKIHGDDSYSAFSRGRIALLNTTQSAAAQYSDSANVADGSKAALRAAAPVGLRTSAGPQ